MRPGEGDDDYRDDGGHDDDMFDFSKPGFAGMYENDGSTQKQDLDEVIIESYKGFDPYNFDFENAEYFGMGDEYYGGGKDEEKRFLEKIDNITNPLGLSLAPIEWRISKALDKYNDLDQIKGYNEKWRLNDNPFLKTRPINIEIPVVSRHIEVARDIVSDASKALQGLSIVTSVISAANDIEKYRNGEISGAHLTVNLIMNAVGFLGPVGAGINFVYGFAEDWLW